ncbi:uncharacterized protein TNCV_4735951 [Trichonephila clavipes]|nr:uncharacterized protein TNCV_4735951 [Trichonephila clavipes]
MKTRCLKCGGGHRTGQCEIKDKIVNPTCINCNAQGHMASSTECPLFPKPRRRAARGSDSSTSNSENKNKNKSFNSETLNHINCQGGDFSFLEAIFEMKKIFDLFPNLISEMKKSSKCTDPTDKLQCLLKGVEATLVALTPSDQEPFLVASIYAPPGPNYRNLGADLDGIFNIFKSAFLAGDYNAKHTPGAVITATPENFQFCYPPPQLNTTWSIFTKILANPDNFFLPTANSTHEIDSQVSNLTDEILNAHASASRPFYHTEQPYVQGELKELFKERNKARKTWQHTRHPQHKTELNRLQNAIKRKIYHYRQQAWEDNLSTLNAEDNSLWELRKAFRKKTSPISALNGPTGIALSDTNKTEVIAHSLEKQFHLNDIHNPRKDEIITSVVDAYMDSNINNTDIIPPLSHLKLFRSLKRLKSKSVRGEMGSLTKCLKNYRASLFSRLLTSLIIC